MITNAFEILPIPPLTLGEGPLWDAAGARFLVVDIHGRAVPSWSPATGEVRRWDVPERIGWLFPRRDGDGFIAGLQSGFARLWLTPRLRVQPIGSPHPGRPELRLNDAKADAQGRIWAGSLNDEDFARADGQLACLDADGGIDVVERGLHVCNGPAITPDGRWLFHTDSWVACTWRYRLHEDGTLADKQLWQRFDPRGGHGFPDGMCFDADGALWIAFFRGGCVRRYSVEGELLRQIDLPARKTTSVAFGGDDCATLVVTSAHEGYDAAARAAQPLAGATFALRPGVEGLRPLAYGRA